MNLYFTHTHCFLFYTNILLLQNSSKYPESHPLSQCPFVELQVFFNKQFPLQWLLQSIPNVSFSQPVVKNINILYYKTYNNKFCKNIFIKTSHTSCLTESAGIVYVWFLSQSKWMTESCVSNSNIAFSITKVFFKVSNFKQKFT